MHIELVNNLKILIVEDDPSLRVLLKKFLGVFNTVETAIDLATASTLISDPETYSFDVVLLDKGLPDGNGLTLIPSLLKHSPLSAIIVFTGENDYRAVQESLALGAHDFIVKSDNLLEELGLRIPIARAHANARRMNRGHLSEAAGLLPGPNKAINADTYKRFLEFCERTYIEEAMNFLDGHISNTADQMGLARSTLWKKMTELGMKGH